MSLKGNWLAKVTLALVLLVILEQTGHVTGCTDEEIKDCAQQCKKKWPCYPFRKSCCVDVNTVRPPFKGSYCLCCFSDCPQPRGGVLMSIDYSQKICPCMAVDDTLNAEIQKACYGKEPCDTAVISPSPL